VPQPLSALAEATYLKALLIGAPKTSKTTVAVCTSPYPVRVLLCEDESALAFPLVVFREQGLTDAQIAQRVDYELITGEKSMLNAIVQARQDAEAGKIKTIVVDPLTFLADKYLEEAFALTKTGGNNEDGRRAHPEATRRVRKMVDQLLRLPANVVVCSHYMDVGDAAKGGGDGKVPMLPNKEMRSVVAGMFPNVVWIDIKGGDYRLVTTPKGAFGPGCRGLKGFEEIPADIEYLMAALGLAPKSLLQKQGIKLGGPTPAANGANGSAKPAPNGSATKPPAAKSPVKSTFNQQPKPATATTSSTARR
jgi:hypothetical protein